MCNAKGGKNIIFLYLSYFKLQGLCIQYVDNPSKATLAFNKSADDPIVHFW
ncbi:conserved hypothetical protein [Yersinia pestis KIM D27]|uniref:Uncharacterized protein n=2 Tax=Yersinia pseudotuberculosis complex TaxID=1649845 RepID=A0A0H3B688_YERPY|nr:hypothetical protein YpAngola_A1025 [Yersinia pestis Angola]EDR34063.1 hypothetical protein YPIP275_4108 [Yersinia pestis biovar Orientalis str. IP275]EDR39527.1 hypothetical protein YpF1991016_2515 [Yersinia pestis biovar Orientalis str. F1991016]EDR43244.1 hypothetical protein YpE1979001_2190 [Yersinia pestis biovar Antiqua str. E1979001]EDR57439.1 hypothetical protein YpMG051020_4323 [Yersinia pestis biovar Orientalis str. MG05-1020]EFA48507.1 conserved hypothetical protein [Yersinia pes